MGAFDVEQKLFTCPSRESNPGRCIYRQTRRCKSRWNVENGDSGKVDIKAPADARCEVGVIDMYGRRYELSQHNWHANSCIFFIPAQEKMVNVHTL